MLSYLYFKFRVFQDSSDPTIDRMRRAVDDVILGQQTALEIFTNICCDEVSADWEDADSVSLKKKQVF